MGCFESTAENRARTALCLGCSFRNSAHLLSAIYATTRHVLIQPIFAPEPLWITLLIALSPGGEATCLVNTMAGPNSMMSRCGRSACRKTLAHLCQCAMALAELSLAAFVAVCHGGISNGPATQSF